MRSKISTANVITRLKRTCELPHGECALNGGGALSRGMSAQEPPGGPGINLYSRNFLPIVCPVHNEGHGTGSINSISGFLVYLLWRNYGQNRGLTPSRDWPYRLDPE